MQLAPLRFTKIEGTTVAVNVASAAEAKAALKELRHKKRELKFLRGALAKQHKAAKGPDFLGPVVATEPASASESIPDPKDRAWQL